MGKLVHGILIAILAAFLYDLFKVKFPALSIPPTWVGAPATKDVIEPKAGPPIHVASGKQDPPPADPPPRVARVVVPNFVGMEVGAAFQIAESLGLQVRREDGADRYAAGSVESQWPAVHQLAEAGSTVSLGVRVSENRFERRAQVVPEPPLPTPVPVPPVRVPTPPADSQPWLTVPRHPRPGSLAAPADLYERRRRDDSIFVVPGKQGPYSPGPGQPYLMPYPRRHDQPQPQNQTWPRYQQRAPFPGSSYQHRTFAPGPRYPQRPQRARPPGNYRRHGF